MKSVTPSGSLGLEMRVGLWIIQVLLAVVFASTGAVQTLPPIEEVTRLLPQFVDYHPLLIRIIGISELLGAAGLILPGLTGIRPGEEEEKLVVLLEVRQGLELTETGKSVRRLVAAAHDLRTHDVALVRPGTLRKTTSGKIRRQACRADYLDGTLIRWDTGQGGD